MIGGQTTAVARPRRDEPISGRSLKRIAWSRFRHDPVGMASLVVIALVALVAVTTPLITHLLGLRPNDLHDGLIGDGALPRYGPLHSGISWQHPLGVEPATGRDILARLLYGSRVSLLIATLGTLFTVVIGVSIGLVAGYLGGRVDTVLGRLMDLVLSFPQLLLFIALSPVLIQFLGDRFHLQGNAARITFLVVAFAVFGWPAIARIVRGQVLSLREREFTEAAISLGARTPHVLVRELLPNLWVPIIVYTTLLLPVYIALEAALSFLGVGVIEPTATWGKMLADSVTYYQVDPLYLFIPGTSLFIVVLAFNLLGDSLRDALDPRGKRT